MGLWRRPGVGGQQCNAGHWMRWGKGPPSTAPQVVEDFGLLQFTPLAIEDR